MASVAEASSIMKKLHSAYEARKLLLFMSFKQSNLCHMHQIPPGGESAQNSMVSATQLSVDVAL